VVVSRWRFGRGWSEHELRAVLHELRGLSVNFDTPVERMTRQYGWTVDGADRPLGYEPPGPPLDDGLFVRAKQAITNYDFSDPRIVVGHFDPRRPLAGRDMLLEIKVLGFRFLNGVRVHTVRDESHEQRTSFGYRYDTLVGHIEQGFEWFLLSKRHETGEVRFRIEAHWRLGTFPNWWSRVGFLLLGERFRHVWRKRAVSRLRRLARQPARGAVAGPRQLAHRGDNTPRRRSDDAG
jgi:uncharacterized protein (UPF0548 family)